MCSRQHGEPCGGVVDAGRRGRDRLGCRKVPSSGRFRRERRGRRRIGERGLAMTRRRHDQVFVDAVTVEQLIGGIEDHFPGFLGGHLAHDIRGTSRLTPAPAAGRACLQSGGGEFAHARAVLEETATLVTAIGQLLELLPDLRRAARPLSFAALGRLLRAVVAAEHALQLVLVLFWGSLAAQPLDAVADRLIDFLLAIMAPLAEREGLS